MAQQHSLLSFVKSSSDANLTSEEMEEDFVSLSSSSVISGTVGLRASQVGSITLKVLAVQPLKVIRGQKWIDSNRAG